MVTVAGVFTLLEAADEARREGVFELSEFVSGIAGSVHFESFRFREPNVECLLARF